MSRLRPPLAAVTPNTSWSAHRGQSLAHGGSAQTAKLVSVGRGSVGRPRLTLGAPLGTADDADMSAHVVGGGGPR